MSGFRYTARIEKERFRQIVIDSKSVATLGDLKREICRQSTVEREFMHIWASGQKISQNPDSTLLTTIGLTSSDNISVRELRRQQEQGGIIIFKPTESEKLSVATNNNKPQALGGSPIQGLDVNQKQLQKKQLDNDNDDDDEFQKDPALWTFEEKFNYRPKMRPKPEPKWPQLPERALKERRQEAVQALTKKLQQQGWQNAQEWAAIGHGRQKQIKAFRNNNHGLLINKQICDFIEKHLIRRIIRHYMNCKPTNRHRQALLTTYGLIDFVFDKATQYYPALDLMQQNKKKMFYDIAGVQWFHAEHIIPNPEEDQAYIKGLPAFTDQSIVAQMQMITKDKQKAVKLVEISQNDLQTALRIFEKGESAAREEEHLLKMQERQEKDIGAIVQWQQQPYLFVWLMNQRNYLLRLRIFADPSFLQVLTLSMKHLCPGLFNLLVKHRSYILKIINLHPPRLYRQKPEF